MKHQAQSGTGSNPLLLLSASKAKTGQVIYFISSRGNHFLTSIRGSAEKSPKESGLHRERSGFSSELTGTKFNISESSFNQACKFLNRFGKTCMQVVGHLDIQLNNCLSLWQLSIYCLLFWQVLDLDLELLMSEPDGHEWSVELNQLLEKHLVLCSFDRL